MSAGLAWFAGNMVWTSAAMLLVLAIRRPVAHFLGAGAAYALWLVPALRLVAPPAAWLFPDNLPGLPPLLLFVDAEGGAPPPLGGSGQWMPILLAVWAGGALSFLLYQAVGYRRFLKRLSLSIESVGDCSGVPLLASAAVDGPLALGLADRRIVVPADFDTRYSGEEQSLALAHERHHHRRGDILANHLALLVLALNWCNPVAWFAFRAFRADQELSCDAAVAATASPGSRRAYAHALVKSASRPGLIAACPLHHADQLKRRLKMLTRHRQDRRRLAAGIGLTFTLVATSMMFGASSQAQGAKQQERRERTIIIEEHGNDGQGANAEPREVLRRNLSPEMVQRIENCQGDNQVTNINEGEGNRRTRVMICARGGEGSANRVEALQRALERVSNDEHISAGTKQRILAQLRAEIGRARSGD